MIDFSHVTMDEVEREVGEDPMIALNLLAQEQPLVLAFLTTIKGVDNTSLISGAGFMYALLRNRKDQVIQ